MSATNGPKKIKKRNNPSTTSSSSTTTTTQPPSSSSEPITYKTKYIRDAHFRIHEVQIRKEGLYCSECRDEGYWFCIAEHCPYENDEEVSEEQYEHQKEEDEKTRLSKKVKIDFTRIEEEKEQITKCFRTIQSILNEARKENETRSRSDIHIKGWNNPEVKESWLGLGVAGSTIGRLCPYISNPYELRSQNSANQSCFIRGCCAIPSTKPLFFGVKTTSIDGTSYDNMPFCELNPKKFEGVRWSATSNGTAYICDYHAAMVNQINIEFNQANPPFNSINEKEKQSGAFVIMKLMRERDKSCILSGITFDLPDDLLSIVTSYLF